MARIQNCVTVTNPCDGSSSAAQNVVTAYGFDPANHLTDTYTPAPGCSANCVPAPTCIAGPPPSCTSPAAPCPTSSCVDFRNVYDSTGRIAQEIANYGGAQDASQANLNTIYAYDADGRVTDIYLPITSATLQTGQIDEHRIYDVLGRLVTDIKANSMPSWMTPTTPARTDYARDLGGRVVSVTGPGTGSMAATNRIVTTTDYDDLGRPLYVTADSGVGHLNAVTRNVYDPRGAFHTWTPATYALSAGMETTSNSDLAGQVVSVVKDDGTGGLHLTTSTSYDAYGRATDIADPRGIDTNTAYDALDRAISVTQNYCPVGNSNPNCSGSGILPDQNLATGYVYDLAGSRIETINPRGTITYTAFEALFRPFLVTESCQTVPTPPATSCGTESSDQNISSGRSYDQLGNVLTATDPLGRVNVFAYDALARKVSETDNCVGSGGQCNGGVTSGQNLLTTAQVDAQGDVLQVRSPRQCTSAAPCYQGASGTTLTDGGNLATGYTYDGLLRLASVIEDQSTASGHLNLVTSYSYDPSGDRLTQVDGRGLTTTSTVDNLGRVTTLTDANSYAVQTYYSLAGEVIGTYNARHQLNTNQPPCTQANETVCNTLDRVGRLTGVSYLKSDGSTQLTQSFGYDADGNMTSYSDTDVAQTTVTYDHLNRPSTVTSPAPLGTTTYTHFLDGAINTISDATGTTTFTEDRLGQVATMVSPLITGTTTFAFDAAGRLTGRTEANGIVTTVGYTGMDQLASKTEVTSPANGSTTLASWMGVAYDLAQNRIAETLTYYAGNPYPDPHSGASATYQYDSLNRLSQSSIPGTSAANYGFDAAHNLIANAGVTQAYNNNESLQTVGPATTGADADGNEQKDVLGNVLSWNSLSQLEKFSITETYAYDALGRLTTVSNGGGVTTQFVYQGLSGQVVEELDGAGGVVRSYAWDTLRRELYTKIGTNAYYEITDPHSDVVALASATALVGTAHFDSWGNAFTPSGTTVPFGFQGAPGSWTDPATGFVSMGLRWYYPKVGRFLSSDPAAGSADPRAPLDGQRWLYASNNPLGNIDPSGLGCAWWDVYCHTEAYISNAFNQASSAAIAVYNAANTVINWVDTALVNGLKTVLGTNATDKGKNDVVSKIQRAVRKRVIQAAKAGAVITEQVRPLAVNVTKSAADEVAKAVNSCQNATKSVGNALGCAVAGVTVASMLVVPEGGAAANVVIQGAERGAPKVIDLAIQGVEHGAPEVEDLLVQTAIKAKQAVESGSGATYGTAVHTAFENEVKALGRSDLSTEVSYFERRIVPRGTPGSVRLDVVEGSRLNPTAIYDLKTGLARLSQTRIDQIRAHLPLDALDIPIVGLFV